jgi:hypothetical protein
MRVFIGFLSLVAILTACNNNGGDNAAAPAKDTTATQPVVVASGPPARVSGIFKGKLPCSDCQEIEAIIDIKDNTYTYNFIRKGETNKMKLLGNRTGDCVFENGVLKLMNEGKPNEQFRMLSTDSIRLEAGSGLSAKDKKTYLLLRTKTGN